MKRHWIHKSDCSQEFISIGQNEWIPHYCYWFWYQKWKLNSPAYALIHVYCDHYDAIQCKVNLIVLNLSIISTDSILCLIQRMFTLLNWNSGKWSIVSWRFLFWLSLSLNPGSSNTAGGTLWSCFCRTTSWVHSFASREVDWLRPHASNMLYYRTSVLHRHSLKVTSSLSSMRQHFRPLNKLLTSILNLITQVKPISLWSFPELDRNASFHGQWESYSSTLSAFFVVDSAPGLILSVFSFFVVALLKKPYLLQNQPLTYAAEFNSFLGVQVY